MQKAFKSVPPTNIMEVTILSKWDRAHLQKLRKKFEARGLEIVISEDGTSAVIEGNQWASLEAIKGQVKRDTCVDYSLMPDLLP